MSEFNDSNNALALAIRAIREEERAKVAAEVDRLRAELGAIGDIAYRGGSSGNPAAMAEALVEIHRRAKRGDGRG